MDRCVERTITNAVARYNEKMRELAQESKERKNERDDFFEDLMSRQAERNRQRKEGWFD